MISYHTFTKLPAWSLFRKNSTLLSGAALLAVFLLPNSSYAMANFDSAKKVLPQIYYQLDQKQQTTTIYCGCDIKYEVIKKDNNKSTRLGKNDKVKWNFDATSCGYTPRNDNARAYRIEVEHVMPAWEFGNQLECWKNGGRKQCGRDKTFTRMEGDLHNLFPSIGEVNGDRANFQFSDWNGKPNQYGKCTMLIDFKEKRAQPPKESRGRIARAYLYMSEQYDIKLSNQQRRLYEAWNRMYPANEIECERNKLIKQKQKNENRFITESCQLKKN